MARSWATSDDTFAMPAAEMPDTPPLEIEAITAEPVEGDAVFIVKYAGHETISVRVGMRQLPHLMQTVWNVARRVINFHSAPERNEAVVDDLVKHALRPSAIGLEVDRETGERVYLMQFAEHAPIAVRLTLEQVALLRTSDSDLARRLNH